MKIKKLNLYTDKLELEKQFYTKQLGFELVADEPDQFTLRVGWSQLSFTRSVKKHVYHYCFLVPCNQLSEALAWIEQRTDVIEIEKGRKTQKFDTWNAESFYFYDASGNIAEFIVRFDLENNSQLPFESASLLCVNEMGLPNQDIPKTHTDLKKLVGTDPWKGDLARFGTNGNNEGIFLLPNYDVKDKWFPTNDIIVPEPFEILVENQGNQQALKFDGQGILAMDASEFGKS